MVNYNSNTLSFGSRTATMIIHNSQHYIYLYIICIIYNIIHMYADCIYVYTTEDCHFKGCLHPCSNRERLLFDIQSIIIYQQWSSLVSDCNLLLEFLETINKNWSDISKHALPEDHVTFFTLKPCIFHGSS